MPNGIRMNITVAPYSKISFGVWALPPPVPPPGRCAWLASATTASSAVSAIPLSTSLREPLMAETLDKHGDRAALGLEDRVLDVAEILAVDLQRQRPVAGDLDPVEVVAVDAASRARTRPAGDEVAKQARQGRRASPASVRTGRGRARSGPPGATWIGIGPAYVYGSVFATSANAARPSPPTSSTGSKRSRRSATRPRAAAMKAASPGRLPSSRRPSASTLRTSSASKPSPAEKLKRRPFTRPTEIVLVRPASSASPTCRAAAAGSRGRPSARESTFAPPPGRKASGMPARAPFSTSLKPPSPERTRSASPSAAEASSIPWPGRSVSSGSHLCDPPELALDCAHASLADGARVRVHDQDDFHKLARG